MLKVLDISVYEYLDITTFGSKNEKVYYEKRYRGGETRMDERGREGHWRNKVNPVVKESTDSETSVYYHRIY